MIRKLNRREVIVAAGAGIAGLAVMGPSTASATPEATQQALDKVLGGKTVEMGGVDLEAPIIAENGGNVPVAMIVDSPMTKEDHVRAIHLFAEKNPTPAVASFYFTQLSGKAEVRLNIRMAESQKITAIAEMSDGSFRGAEKDVKVTIGGCGG